MNKNYKASIYAALALAFASFGDAFLYPYLPMQSMQIGIPVEWVGFLLSVNRFVRIFINTFIVYLQPMFGLRMITIIGVILAILSTVGYALSLGILGWIMLRVVWGVSFSILRLSSIVYALDHPQKGLSLGISKSLQEAGPILALLLAPLLLNYFESDLIFLLLSIASLPALYFAFKLPQKVSDIKNSIAPLSFISKIPSVFNLITFGSAFLIDGVLVVSLGVLFIKYSDGITVVLATAMATTFLGFRRILLLAFSSVGGWLADKIGLKMIFLWSYIITIMALFFLSFGWIETGIVIVFIFYSIQSVLVPANISKECENQIYAVAENTTWRDLGAALGTLAGGFLLTSNQLLTIILIATFSLLVLLLFYLGSVKDSFKLLLSWK